MLNYNVRHIDKTLVLRPPQKESLERFACLCDILSLDRLGEAKKVFAEGQRSIAEPDFFDPASVEAVKHQRDALVAELTSNYQPICAEDLSKVHAQWPTLTNFERNFPSVCFALATGIGKTRLMGALIAYLVYEKGYKNFFVMAPNLTIYKKLKDDLGNPTNPKYVFRGLDRFVNPPRIIDGDNYEQFRQGTLSDANSDITINVFNISKLNSESGRMRRLQEVLGQSYFAYLQSLPDLSIFMDESHHYHADRGFETINELHPIGVELTVTPQTQKGSRKVLFENVIYEYPLAQALNDGRYVKVPTVFTRRDFRPEEYANSPQ